MVEKHKIDEAKTKISKPNLPDKPWYQMMREKGRPATRQGVGTGASPAIRTDLGRVGSIGKGKP